LYKLLLILKYLRRKLVPMFAALAVTLCTAMVIIVISVMGGFLSLMEEATQALGGDVTISADVGGFEHYEALASALERHETIEAVTPVIRALGLVRLYEQSEPVEVQGIEPRSFDRVTGFRSTLYWDAEATGGEAPGADPIAWGMAMQGPDHWPALPGAVPGIEVNPYAWRDPEGAYRLERSALGATLTLSLLPLTRRGGVLEPVVRDLAVVNEFKSGLYEIDNRRIYVPFAFAQRLLKMDAAIQADPETGEPTGETVPARTHELIVRGVPGLALERVMDAVTGEVERFTTARPEVPPLRVRSWRQRHAQLLGAVENEKSLLTILFGIISIVAVAMIAVIFYMIVLEKTRDIGILRAIGASRSGILLIFLGYGLAIGVVGALLGLAAAAGVVWNINAIQDFLSATIGFEVWNPQIYYFDRVPAELDPVEVPVILAAAVASSLAGSLVPAILAARLDPVQSLRYE